MPNPFFALEIVVPSAALQADPKMVVQALRWGATEIARRTRALLAAAAGTGRRYKGIQASLPGLPPAKRTGLLAGSIRTSVRVRANDNVIVARILDVALDKRSNKPYGKFLETGAAGMGGHRSGGRRVHRGRSFEERKAAAGPGAGLMEPRPYLSRVMESTRNVIQARIEEAVKKGISLKPTPRSQLKTPL